MSTLKSGWQATLDNLPDSAVVFDRSALKAAYYAGAAMTLGLLALVGNNVMESGGTEEQYAQDIASKFTVIADEIYKIHQETMLAAAPKGTLQ